MRPEFPIYMREISRHGRVRHPWWEWKATNVCAIAATETTDKSTPEACLVGAKPKVHSAARFSTIQAG
jgi:hypothetical protein